MCRLELDGATDLSYFDFLNAFRAWVTCFATTHVAAWSFTRSMAFMNA